MSSSLIEDDLIRECEEILRKSAYPQIGEKIKKLYECMVSRWTVDYVLVPHYNKKWYLTLAPRTSTLHGNIEVEHQSTATDAIFQVIRNYYLPSDDYLTTDKNADKIYLLCDNKNKLCMGYQVRNQVFYLNPITNSNTVLETIEINKIIKPQDPKLKNYIDILTNYYTAQGLIKAGLV